MANLAATAVEPDFVEIDDRHCYESWKITGTAAVANDTVVIKTKLSKPDYIIGPFAIASISGQNVTIKSYIALGGDTVGLQLHGRVGTGMF